MALGAAQEKLDKYAAGGNTMKHEAGKDAVQIAMVVISGVHTNKPDFDAGRVGKFDMEFEGEGLPCTKCKFDVQLTDGNKPRLIEYKSYLDASKIQLPQFLNYIASVNDLLEMKYVFNASKLSTEQAREGMKVFMSNSGNRQSIWNVMSNELKENILGIGNSVRYDLFQKKLTIFLLICIRSLNQSDHI